MNAFRRQNDGTPVDSPENQKEPLFEKSLTPSDVGKLNRLVIPKQHAEKHFPLNGISSSPSSSGGCSGHTSLAGEKGLVLSFEDETGKCWKFRYSYWNSSQSYVLTKGWSRYVKEKQLDAGDVVFFLRHRSDSNRLFIGWRKRGEASNVGPDCFGNATLYSGGNRGMMLPYHYQVHHHHCHESSFANPLSQPECSCPGGAAVQTPPVGNSKTLRLFGVNMECQPDDQHGSEPSSPDGSSRGSAQPTHFYSHQPYPPPYHMNISFSGDVNQMGNRQG